MADFTHLFALMARRSHDLDRIDAAIKGQNRTLRTVWLAQIEKEIDCEHAFLGIAPIDAVTSAMSDDELLAELS